MEAKWWIDFTTERWERLALMLMALGHTIQITCVHEQYIAVMLDEDVTETFLVG